MTSIEVKTNSLFSWDFMGFWKYLQMVTEEWRQVITLPLKKAVWLEFLDILIVLISISIF